MVVGVNCWLLAGCWGLVVAVASVAISDGGGSEGSVGRWWCGWVFFFVREAGLGSSIFTSGVRSSRGGIALEGGCGRYLQGRPG